MPCRSTNLLITVLAGLVYGLRLRLSWVPKHTVLGSLYAGAVPASSEQAAPSCRGECSAPGQELAL